MKQDMLHEINNRQNNENKKYNNTNGRTYKSHFFLFLQETHVYKFPSHSIKFKPQQNKCTLKIYLINYSLIFLNISMVLIFSNSTTETAILRLLCLSQVRIKEERWTEGVQIPPSVKRTRRQKPTMNDLSTKSYRLGRRPGKQGPRPLPSNQGRVEKLATGKNLHMNYTTKNTQKLKLAKSTMTVGTWNVQTLWATGKLELLRNEMKRFRYDIIGISEV